MTSNKKVLIITTSLQMGGIERASSNIANEFAIKGLDVYFFCIFRHKKFFKLDERITLFEPESSTHQRINLLKAPFRIRTIVNKINPHTILVFTKFLGALTLFALTGKNNPVYISERANPNYKFSIHFSIFNKIIYKLYTPAGIIAQTNYAASLQKLYYKKETKIKVINNAVREIKVYDLPKKNIILAVGRFNDNTKGFDLLIEAFSKIKNKTWTLVFAGGDKNSGSDLYNIAKRYRTQDRIHFLGKISEIDKTYAEAAIFVLPSRSEGYPNALVEAMSAGLPCVAFNYGPGITEIIEHNNNGLLVDNGNTSALAEAIDFLIENVSERNRLGENAKMIKKKLSMELISSQFLDFILPE